MATALANDHFQEATVRMRAAPVLALSVRSRKPLSNRAAETAEFREQPKRRFQRQTPHAKPRRCWIEHSLACFKFRFLNRPLKAQGKRVITKVVADVREGQELRSDVIDLSEVKQK